MSIEENVFYVNLDSRAAEVELVKKLSGDYLGKTFDDVIGYMLTPSGDELNEAYSPDQTESVRIISGLYNSKDEPGSESIDLTTVVKGTEIVLPFSDTLSKHFDSISKVETYIEDGKSKERNTIYLSVVANPGGGM